MIRHVLSDAVTEIRNYLENPVFARSYQGALRDEILRVLAHMDRVREHLDTPPASPVPDERHENWETVEGRDLDWCEMLRTFGHSAWRAVAGAGITLIDVMTGAQSGPPDFVGVFERRRVG